MAAFDPDQLVTVSDLADQIEMSRRRLDQILVARNVPKQERGRVQLKAALQAYIATERASFERQAAREANDSRLHEAKAREIEARVAAREGRLIDLAEHNEIGAELFAMIRQAFEPMPTAATDDPVMRERLRQEVEGIIAAAEKRFDAETAELVAQTRARA